MASGGSDALLEITQEGWCPASELHPSPNFDQRANGVSVSLLVIHNISLPPGRFGGGFVGELFLNCLDYSAHPYFEQLRDLHVSSHFLIDREGRLTQFVSTEHRAWHAGLSVFQGRERCNDFSIGIELEGTDDMPFTPAQYDKLAATTAALQRRYPLTHVAGHEHIAPGRKTDPGPFFDWRTYQLLLDKLWCESDRSHPPQLLFPVSRT